MSRIYLSPPHVGAEERRLLLEALESNWIAPVGPHLDLFEQEFAARLALPGAVALSSGTAALHLALHIVGVKRHDEVLTSTLTFAATANAIVYLDARPVFLDSSPNTWTMEPDLLEEELDACARRGRLPKAVMTVDLYGQCADYDRIVAACRRYEVPLIADATEALGATYRGDQAGRFGEMAAFSFNGNKIITSGGGGMLVSKRVEWTARARFLAAQARDPAPHYQHSEIGFNYRLSNLLAAVGRGQLRSLDERVDRRRANNDTYRRQLEAMPGIAFMPEATLRPEQLLAHCITVDPREFGMTREDIRAGISRRTTSRRARSGSRCISSQPSKGAGPSAGPLPHGCSSWVSACPADRASRTQSVSVSSTRSPPAANRHGHRTHTEPPPKVIRQSVIRTDPAAKHAALTVPALPEWLMRYRSPVIWLLHVGLAAASSYLAFWLRFDGAIPNRYAVLWRDSLAALLVARGTMFFAFRLYEGLWRYTSIHDLLNILLSIGSSSLVFAVAVEGGGDFGAVRYPISILLIDALLLTGFAGGIRFATRIYRDLASPTGGRKVLIYGAGDAGAAVVREMRLNLSRFYDPVGFIDDDRSKVGRRIHGVRVLGTRSDLPRILKRHRPDEVLVTIPRADPSTYRAVVRSLEPFEVPIKTLPHLREILDGKVSTSLIRDLSLEDLLRRSPVGLSREPFWD